MPKTVHIRRMILAALCLLPLSGCAHMARSEQSLLVGAVVGTGAGVAVTAASGGCIPCGAGLGALAGSTAGYAFAEMTE